AATQEHSSTHANGATSSSTVGRYAIVAGDDVRLDAGRDLISQAAVVVAQRDILGTAGRDILVGTQTEHSHSTSQGATGKRGKQNTITETHTQQHGSELLSGRHTTLIAQRDLTISGANISAGLTDTGNIGLQAHNIHIGAAVNQAT